PDDDRGRDNPAPEPKPAADMNRQGGGDIGAQHVQRAVGNIDDARDAENQRQAGGNKEQARRGREAVDRLKEEGAWIQSLTGRSFFTSASDGSTAAPSTYLKSTMIGLPSFR